MTTRKTPTPTPILNIPPTIEQAVIININSNEIKIRKGLFKSDLPIALSLL